MAQTNTSPAHGDRGAWDLTASIALRRGGLQLEGEFRIAGGETVVVVGPNGAGKSTTLHALAGLLPLSSGRVSLGQRLLEDPAAGVRLPPEARSMGVVFQDHLLFPHMNVLENVAFGPRGRGMGRKAAQARAAGWLDRLGIPADLHRAKPSALSGGQSGRVALARALALEPRVLLLDEPLAAVDASARLGLRRELREHLADFPGPRLLVAHDVADALALADWILVMESGRVAQAGTLPELASRPATPFVADLVGLNCLRGTGQGRQVSVAGMHLTVATEVTGEVLVTVHPRAISLFPHRPAGSPRNVWQAPVAALEPTLDRVRVRLGGPLPVVAEVTHAAVDELGLAPGAVIWAAMKATELVVSYG